MAFIRGKGDVVLLFKVLEKISVELRDNRKEGTDVVSCFAGDFRKSF